MVMHPTRCPGVDAIPKKAFIEPFRRDFGLRMSLLAHDGCVLIGIAGGTASGKTTLAKRLALRLPDALLVGHDRYYHTVSNPSGHNYDSPDALESDLLAYHLDELRAGRPVQLPVYDYTHHRRSSESETASPSKYVIVEGILVLCEPLLAGRFNLRVWVEADDDVRLIRRIRRDVVERGRSVDSVLNQYERTVRPSHIQWVRPQRALADLVLDGEAPIETEVERMRQTILAV